MHIDNQGKFVLKYPEHLIKCRPLFGLSELKRHIGKIKRTLILVEGEDCAKCVNALGYGLFAMSPHGGADNMDKADYSPLARQTVKLWADNDMETGKSRKGMETAAKLLIALDCKVYMIDETKIGLPDKGDVKDFIFNWLERTGYCAEKKEVTPEFIKALDRSVKKQIINQIRAIIDDASVPGDKVTDVPAVIGDAVRPQGETKEWQGVELIWGNTIIPEAYDWIWTGWIAAGKLQIFGGAPGCGKTTLTLSIMATISNGGQWPDGSNCEAGKVLMWSGEDGVKDTLAPRLMAAGANMNEIAFCGQVKRDMKGNPLPFDPSIDMPLLAKKMEEIGNVRLLVLDSVASAVGGDSHNNTETRRGLQPIVDLAQSVGCAVIGITHITKGSRGKSNQTERLNGSTAFGAVARGVWMASKDVEGGGRTLARSKSNLSLDHGGFSYSLETVPVPEYPHIEASRVVWGEALIGEASDLMNKSEGLESQSIGSKTSDAVEFLESQLAEGEMPSSEVKIAAKNEGITNKPLRKAFERLKVISREDRNALGHLKTHWKLPFQTIPKVNPQYNGGLAQ
jgi:hypothetical protein